MTTITVPITQAGAGYIVLGAATAGRTYYLRKLVMTVDATGTFSIESNSADDGSGSSASDKVLKTGVMPLNTGGGLVDPFTARMGCIKTAVDHALLIKTVTSKAFGYAVVSYTGNGV